MRYLLCFVTALVATAVSAEQPTPGYNTKIPESIMTPADIKTRAGTLKYFDGIPTKESAAALYNHLDYIRGVESFLNGMPAASLEAIRRSQVVQGSVNSYQVRIFDQLMDSNPLFLTSNTDTVYVSAVLDLKRAGSSFYVCTVQRSLGSTKPGGRVKLNCLTEKQPLTTLAKLVRCLP
jgi:hypothetical protein